MRKQTLVMVILDGWGVGENNSSNPIYMASPPQINYIKHTYPAGTLQAAGIAVGLPWGEEGDSEVGHLTLGAGKVIYQHYPRISIAIKDGSFFRNDELMGAFSHARSNKSRVHFVGLIGSSNVHSSFEHLKGLLEFAEKQNTQDIKLHLFTDGRDSLQNESLKLISELPEEKIASVSGRYFAMDKDLHWDRTEKTYNVLIGSGVPAKIESTDAASVIGPMHARGITDEFIEPSLLQPDGVIKENDAVIFFNFREDAMQQMAQMFANPNAGQPHTIPKNLYITTFTRYSRKLNFPVAFPPESITNPLGKVLSDAGKVQLRIAETMKYAHVTYFFNGFTEPPFENEYRVLIPSQNIVRQDEFPEMMATQVTTRALSAISEGVYDFILVNYANPDVIAHTGNFDAAMKAINTVDEQIGILMKAILDRGDILVITSDHGNVEKMIDQKTGIPETTHNKSPVPIYVVTRGYERSKNDELVREIEKTSTGVLSDVAPTVLELMRIPRPTEMTGVSLLQSLI